MPDNQITNEVNQQFLRRTPVKLRQFSRLLNDMITQEIEPLRVKALLSQVNKIRETCLAQNFESTAKLLNQLLKQLSLSEETLETQKPLLKRLSKKLQEHSEKLELGVKPKKEATVATKKSIDKPKAHIEEELDNEDSVEQSLIDEGIYLDKSLVIFIKESGDNYQTLHQQFKSLGIVVKVVSSLAEAKQFAVDNIGCVIIAPLKFAENNEQLNDDNTELQRIPLIFTADEDTQESRLLSLRSGGTGFMVEPVSLTSLLEHIEKQYDIYANSPFRVLVMEDSKAQARYYDKVLSKGNFDVRVVNDPRILLEALRGFEPETILMDMQMPTCSGIELTRVIRQMQRFTYLPIIFLSAEENLTKQKQALLSGGTSFLVKPVDKAHLMFIVGLYTRRYRELNPQIGVNPDTGMPFSAEFKRSVAIETARMSRNAHQMAFSIIQLDEVEDLIKTANFSIINVAIQQLTLILRQRLRKTDIIGHLKTGQLGIILTTGTKADWISIMDDIRQQFSELSFHMHHQDKAMTVSVGVGMASTNWDAHQWFESALDSLDKAIENGGNKIEANG